MKIFTWPIRTMVFIALMQVLSCTKNVETPNESISVVTSNDLMFPTINEFSNCKLRRIYQVYPDNTSVISGLFTYNAQGNPVSLLYNHYDVADHFFIYDNQRRLREYRITGDFEFDIHAYGYDGSNRIVIDTLSRGRQQQTYQVWVSTFTYDSKGRIIKENIRNIKNESLEGQPVALLPTRNPTFTYDARGNLGVAGWKSSSYDNKTSIFRMHPVFQFIHRNYSVNNSSAQSKYNSKGLPLTVVPGNDVFFTLPNVTKAIYDCQ